MAHKPYMIETSEFAGKCRLAADWPAGAYCRRQLCFLKVGHLPPQVLDDLRQVDPGLAEYLDGNADEEICLGEARITGTYDLGGLCRERYGPTPSMSLPELAQRIRESVVPRAERERQKQQAREAEERLMAERRAEEDRRMRERQAEEAEKMERERRKDPRYCLRKMEELAAQMAQNDK